jgi:hypothetical protein
MTKLKEQRMAAMRLHRCTNAYFVARKCYMDVYREEQRGQRPSPEEQVAWDRTVAGSVRRLETAAKNLDAACSAWAVARSMEQS